MKTITYLKSLTFFIASLCVVSFGYGQSDIIISQYIETSAGFAPKGIEIFNISGADITFTGTNNLQVYQGTNGNPCGVLPGINITSGTLLANEVWVIGTTNLITYASSNGINLSGTTDYGFAFNGDDALQLFLGGIIQDSFGTCGIDPGTSWTGSGVETRNNNLEILDGLCSGNIIGWSDPSTRFNQIADGLIMTGFGNAPAICCISTTTWTAGAWSPSAPTINSSVTLADDYDTASFGSFSACSLFVDTDVFLYINDIDNGALSNTNIEVANDVTIDGTIIMNSKASFVQINDLGAVNVSGTGSIQVEKLTAPMYDWYEYTYWSSPVFEPQIGNALSFSDVSRRYVFNAQNFLDHCAETNNDNTLICDDGFGNGVQDDIDDDGNDWQWVNGSTTMKQGVGYASTHDEAGFISFGPLPWSFKYTFEGAFNNGAISIPIYRNDFEPNDNNWNLIGNPYPSAIDADLFLAANTNINPSVTTPYTLDGAIFLWSQNTAPSGTSNGGEAFNFSDSDYAIINGTGETVGGDGTSPSIILPSGHRAIPSGQAFFVSMSNSAPATAVSGTVFKADNDVVFNNSMRVKGATDNSMFFRNSNNKEKSNSTISNKVWINLNSDNGVFNQTLVGYINGATNNDDGMYYDAIKNISSVTSASLFTTIDGSNKRFAIQGKDINSLNEDEVIKLGFKTSIDVATLYTLSIAQLQGDFLNSNTIYIKDNLLNTLHDISASDYTFTSEVGEFNDRFEIGFNAIALSTEDFEVKSKTLKIVELEDNHVQFTASMAIRNVKIFDLLGRQLYNFKGQNNSETYKLSNLSSSIYIAKVELSNGAIVTKKAFKK